MQGDVGDDAVVIRATLELRKEKVEKPAAS